MYVQWFDIRHLLLNMHRRSSWTQGAETTDTLLLQSAFYGLTKQAKRTTPTNTPLLQTQQVSLLLIQWLYLALPTKARIGVVFKFIIVA
jgi:hypothetical protein